MSSENPDTAAAGTPPYVSFKTFWGFIRELQEQRPLPHHLENSLFAKRSGSARSELLIALRFFDLIRGERRLVQPSLEQLVDDPSSERLGRLLDARYRAILDLDLTRATRTQVDEALREMGAPQSVLGRCRGFLLSAAKEAGINVGQRLTARAPATGGQRKPRAKSEEKPLRIKGGKRGANGGTDGGSPPFEADAELQKQYIELLMEQVKQGGSTDTDLLGRIEWLLGFRSAPPGREQE